MKLKGIIDEDFVNYKLPSMFLGTCRCDGKCYKELNRDKSMCINNEMDTAPEIDVDDDELIKRYLNNYITRAIVFGGLEPILQFSELQEFIRKLREEYHCDDPVVIYTGYYKEEIEAEVNYFKNFKNIIIKFGRYIPDDESRYDDVLGVILASHNQYAEKIS